MSKGSAATSGEQVTLQNILNVLMQASPWMNLERVKLTVQAESLDGGSRLNRDTFSRAQGDRIVRRGDTVTITGKGGRTILVPWVQVAFCDQAPDVEDDEA